MSIVQVAVVTIACLFTILIAIYSVREQDGDPIIILVLTVVILTAIISGVLFYNSTAAGRRYLKDVSSNLNNGILRTITITAEDGREIYKHTGIIDIEMHDNYILFDEDGTRTIIYRGITDTMLIEELKP